MLRSPAMQTARQAEAVAAAHRETPDDKRRRIEELEIAISREAATGRLGFGIDAMNTVVEVDPSGPVAGKLRVGDKILAGTKVDVKPGNAMPFSGMPIGTIVHNVELKPGKGGQIARSAGTYAQFVGRDGGYAQIRLSSGELRMVRQECMATIGAVSNADHSNQNLGKAGRNRHKGIRPSVRGVAMNPIDHPHGGGEGRTSGGRTPVTPWGKDTKGKKTRTNKATDKYILRSRHQKKGR